MSFFLTKTDSKIMYSIAIILMLYHHISGFPEWYNFNYIYSINETIEYPLSLWGGKLCVAIYAFISGYGIYVSIINKSSNMINYIINHLWSFYTRYWLVFLIFIPLNIYFQVWDYTLLDLFLVFSGYKSYYNLEWWYVWEYIRMLIFFPVIYSLLLYLEKTFSRKVFYYLSLIILCIIVRKFAPYLPVFLVGILFAKHHIFEKLDSIISNQIFSVILLSIVLFLRSAEIVHMNSDFVIIPLFIYSIINLKHKCKFFNISKLLIQLSKYSIYMWLIHTFFAKYYLQQFILLPKYTILIFILLFILSLTSSILIDKLYNYIQHNYNLNSNFISKYYYKIYLAFSFILWINFILLFIQSYAKYLI